jgi:hypothetical protein
LRYLRCAPLALLALLALAAPSAGSPQFKSTYKVKLTTKKPATSAGWSADVQLRDPGDPMGRPKILTSVKFNLPAGSKWDPEAHAACEASNADFMTKGPGEFCPKSSRYGSGRASVIVGTTPLSFPITSYNLQPLDFAGKRREILLDVVLDPNNPALSFSIEGRLSNHSVTFSLELAPQYDIHTTDIHFALPAAKKGKHNYLTTPRKCPKSDTWKASVQSTYSDGSKESAPLKLPCSRPR